MVDTFIGMMIISIVTITGMALERVCPIHIQSIIFISIIGLIITIPGMPTADFVAHYVSNVELTTVTIFFKREKKGV